MLLPTAAAFVAASFHLSEESRNSTRSHRDMRERTVKCRKKNRGKEQKRKEEG